MTVISVLQASVDFESSMPLTEVARAIGSTCFGGVPFVGENTGIWDEVPAVRLSKDIIALEIIVGGSPEPDGGFTLEVISREQMGGDIQVDAEGSRAAVCDISAYLTALIEQIPGITIRHNSET